MKKAIQRIKKNALESISEELNEVEIEMQAEEEIMELAREHRKFKELIDRG